MGNHDHRPAILLPQAQQFVLHEMARVDIECREGLVHQDDLRLGNQRLRHLYAFTLPAGKLMRKTVAKTLEADFFEPCHDLGTPLVLGNAPEHQTKLDILKCGLPGKEGVLLKQISDIVLHALDR